MSFRGERNESIARRDTERGDGERRPGTQDGGSRQMFRGVAQLFSAHSLISSSLPVHLCKHPNSSANTSPFRFHLISELTHTDRAWLNYFCSALASLSVSFSINLNIQNSVCVVLFFIIFESNHQRKTHLY